MCILTLDNLLVSCENIVVRSEAKLIIFIFVATVVLFLANFLYQNVSTRGYLLSPVSTKPNVLSFFKKAEKPKRIIFGYLPWWSIEKIKYLQLDKLTHISYFGLYIDKNGNFKTEDENGELGSYENWIENKDLDDLIKNSKKKGIRFALSIVSHEDEVSDKFLSCKECWNNLLQNTIKALKEKKIQDVNINFEYVELVEGDQPKKFVEFVKFFNGGLDAEFGNSFLSVATFADSTVKPRITSELHELGKNCDALFIMAYDFHRPDSDIAGAVAPIGGVDENGGEYDVKTMIRNYLSNVPPNKIIMGVPYYGYNWVVEEVKKEESVRKPGNDEIGYSQAMPYEDVLGVMDEYKPEIKWDDVAKVPFFDYKNKDTNADRVVYFENAESLKEKYKLINDNNLAGVGIWALGYDGDHPELWNLLYESFIK